MSQTAQRQENENAVGEELRLHRELAQAVREMRDVELSRRRLAIMDFVDAKIESANKVDALLRKLEEKEKCKNCAAIEKELEESFELAESELAKEKISGNAVKAEFWQGELAALHRVHRAMGAE